MKDESISYSEFENNNISNENINEKKVNKKIIIIIIITIIIILALVFGLILLLSKNDNKPQNEIKSIYLEQNILNLIVGETKKINIIIEANDPEKIPITWSSNNEEIVIVDNGQITAKKEGNAIIKAKHTTKDGKEYSVECEVIIIDDKPIITYEISNKNWTNKDVIITVNATSKAKIKELKYAINCIDECNYNQIENNKISVKNDGISKVSIQAITELNASAEEIVEVKIDKTKPIVTLSNEKTTYTDTKKVTVCATCQDEESGCKQNELCKDYTSSQSNIKLTLSDKAGNTASSPNFNVVINRQDVNINSTPNCKFSGPINSTINVGNTTIYTLECTDSINQLKDTSLSTNNFSLSPAGIIKITNISKSKITNGYKYTIDINGIAVGKAKISLNAGVVSNINGNMNHSVTSNEVTINASCTRVRSCGCEKYNDWISKGTVYKKASCSSPPNETDTSIKNINCRATSANNDGTCNWSCNRYERTCKQYKCC